MKYSPKEDYLEKKLEIMLVAVIEEHIPVSGEVCRLIIQDAIKYVGTSYSDYLIIKYKLNKLYGIEKSKSKKAMGQLKAYYKNLK